jgi:tripartite-type tricarboxylate transporter receptor subunit TctC
MTSLAMASAMTAPAVAQQWPARPVRIIVPFPPGQAADIVTRLVAESLSVALERQVIVDNRPGAATIIGTELAARAAPDGYTILAGGSSALTIIPHLYRKLPYDPLKDFAPITIIHNVAFVFCVNPSLPVKSISELIALAKQRPGEVTFGSPGSGSTAHLSQVIFASAAGIQLTHVPYKGAIASLTDLISGQISLVAEVTPAVSPLVKAGKIRALGVSSAQRTPFMPEVPSLQEQGIKGYDVIGWTGLVAPTGTPEAILDRMNSEVLKILARPEVKQRLFDLGLVPLGFSRERMARFLRSELAKWGEAVRMSGARIE